MKRRTYRVAWDRATTGLLAALVLAACQPAIPGGSPATGAPAPKDRFIALYCT
ncbi:MAG: hypothetical protein H7338_25315 [Candidatus Sericytochromatia bacterium]|nr:hypothetical protein [Candidatus Sericytochromatia bacterium]